MAYEDYILKNFYLASNVKEDEVESYVFTKHNELLVTLINGRRILYDHMNDSLFYLSKDPMELSEDDFCKYFGRRLRYLIRKKGITQIELSEISGLSKHTLSNYMNGRRSPTIVNLHKLSRALDCSTDDLLLM